jgi:hypothetical protein
MEDLNHSWYERNTGQQVGMSSVGLSIRPSLGWQQPWTASEAVFEAKLMLPWSFSGEMAAEK